MIDPITGSLVSGGLSALGGLFGSSSAKKGMKAIAGAMDRATELNRDMYNRGYADLSPYRNVGTGSLSNLTPGTPLMFLREAAGAESPLYKMRMEDTMNALNRQLGARGLFFSGPAMQNVLSDAARRITAEEAENRWGRNLTLADIGRSAAGFGAQMGQNYATNTGNMLTDNARSMADMFGQQGANWQNTLAGINNAVQGGFANKYFNQYLGNDFDYSPKKLGFGASLFGPGPISGGAVKSVGRFA